MKKASFDIPVKVDGDIFKHFAWFDTFLRQRRWVSPALFAGIMIFFSFIAFSRVGKSQQAALIGSVLLGVGLLLPTVYFLSFHLSVRTQIKKLGLTTPRHVYTLELDGETGVMASTEKEKTAFCWHELFAAYRTNRAIYLYATPRRAYLLPNGQIPTGPDTLWAFLTTVMSPAQLHDRRNRQKYAT